jgi:hypothetical protein
MRGRRTTVARRLLVTVAILGVVFAGLPASSHEVVDEDPNDTVGQFDIRWTSMDHNQNKLFLKMKVSGELQKRDFFGGNYFAWGLDTAAESRVAPAQVSQEEYFVYLEGRWRNGRRKLFCFLYEEGTLVDRFADDITTHVGECPVDRDLIKGGDVPNRVDGFSEFNGHMDVTGFGNHNL